MTDTEQKRKRGPAPRPPEEVRTKRISIRLTPDEYAKVQERAGRDDSRHVADFVRRLALGKPLKPSIPEVNREAWEVLARSSANLNQVARHLNSGEAMQAELIRKQLESFRLALIGAHLDAEEVDDES